MALLSPHRQFKKHTQTLKDRACSGICLRVSVVCILCYLLYYPVLTALNYVYILCSVGTTVHIVNESLVSFRFLHNIHFYCNAVNFYYVTITLLEIP